MSISFNWVTPGILKSPMGCVEGVFGENPESGPLVVLVCDKPEWVEDNPHRVVGDEAGMTVQNVIGTALDRFGQPGRVVVIPILEVSDNIADALVTIQRKLKPVAIIGSGDAVNKVIVKNLAAPGGNGMADDPRLLYNWFRNVSVVATTAKGKLRMAKTRSAITIPLDKWSDPNPVVKGSSGEGLVNLLDSIVSVIANALNDGKNRFSATKYAKRFKHRTNGMPSYQTIKTMAQFNTMMAKLEVCPTPSFDTEGASLSRVANTNYTLQIALPDVKKLYVLPLDHEQSTWSPQERRAISKRMRKYFEFGTSKYTIYHNAAFDINQIMTSFGVRWYNHKVYDTGLGQHCFHPDTLVETDKGRVKISTVCSNPDAYQILSWNHAVGKAELKPISYASTHASNKRMVEIRYTGGSVRVTEDHKVWSVTKNDYVEAGKISKGERVLLKKP